MMMNIQSIINNVKSIYGCGYGYYTATIGIWRERSRVQVVIVRGNVSGGGSLAENVLHWLWVGVERPADHRRWYPIQRNLLGLPVITTAVAALLLCYDNCHGRNVNYTTKTGRTPLPKKSFNWQ